MKQLSRRLFLWLILPLVLIGCGEAGEARLDDALAGDKTSTAKIILTARPSFANSVDADGRTRLHKAALRNQAGAAGLLLEKGAGANATDRYGYTALHYAAQRGHGEIVTLLLDNGASPELKNQHGYTPLHCAAERGREEVVKTLLAGDADPFAVDNNGKNPAELAYEEGFIKIYGLLLPLHDAAKNGDVARLTSLLEKHPDLLETRDHAGRTPLHAAARRDQTEAMTFLIERGAGQDIKDNYGYTADYYRADQRKKRIGINRTTPFLEEEIDRAAFEALAKYEYIKVALVREGEIIFSRSYGEGQLRKDDVWGSVSKPVTAMIVMHLVSAGAIDSIDDPIWEYSSRYQNCMPAEYAGDPLTIRHLLTHTSGVPHNNEPTWKGDKLNLKFAPGTKDQYSTPGYGILGHVIEDVTGKSYSDAVKEYIGRPVGADSYWAEKHFRAPGARVHSTVEDMARFAIGVMKHTYVPSEIFYGEMIQYHSGPSGIGWGVTHKDGPDLLVFHGGSNGKPQAYLEIKPRKELGVGVLARAKDGRNFELNAVSNRLLSILEENQP